MSQQKKYFGTDGIRGKVGVFPISADWALKLGWAAGCVLTAMNHRGKGQKRRVLIGKDTRISGYMFESAIAAGLCAAGVNPGLLGPMPTPAIAYLTRELEADAGIVISASHNSYSDNGFKFFSAEGMKLSDELELAIEAQLEQTMTTVPPSELGKAFRVMDAVERYQRFCESIFSSAIRLSGLKVVVDCAHGATYHIAPALLRRLGAQVIEYGVTPDGLNINEGCGATHPTTLQSQVLEAKADVGIAFDGDGDRLIMVDHLGETVDGDELLFILAKWYQGHKKLAGGIVGTLMSNLGLEKACAEAKIPFHRAKVGDRYVLEAMQQRQATLGGESSGHLICLDVNTTGDGLMSALRILEIMQTKQQSLHHLKQGMEKYPQTLINVPVMDVGLLHEHVGIQAALQTAETHLEGRGRILLRSSGTEPLVRVMVEGQDADLVQRLAAELAQTVKNLLCTDEDSAGTTLPSIPPLVDDGVNIDLASPAH